MLSLDILDHLQALEENGILVIVEGREDKRALQHFGLSSILVFYTKPFYKIMETIQEQEEIAILTDLDQQGRKLYMRIKDECSRKGVKFNNELRHFLFRETSLRHIEGLPRFIQRLEMKGK